jgi:hypothetical protein
MQENADDAVSPNAGYADDLIIADRRSGMEDELSTTSTEEYNQEPFKSFHEKIKALCADLWPDLHPDSFRVTRMNGGGFNRIIGITIDPPRKQVSWCQKWYNTVLSYLRIKTLSESTAPEDLVIRIPRSPNAWVEHEIGVINFLNHNSIIPVPSIKLFDTTADNKLGERYTIQPRIRGISIIDTDDSDRMLYERLNAQQRISLARDIGKALKEMGKLRYNRPGTLDPDTHVPIHAPGLGLLQFQCPNRNAFRPASNEEKVKSKTEDVFNFLMKQCTRQRNYDISCNRIEINPWPQLESILSKMNNYMGLFSDNSYYLTHMDFEPRNLLVDIVDESTAKLTAIMDWDEAIFAPAFLNCKPPSWLWDFEGEDEDLDESKANDIPTNPEVAKIKRAFDEAVGLTYLKYAYKPEYRWARTICRIAITCIHSSQDYKDIDQVITEWNRTYPQWKQKRLWEMSSESN